MSYSQFNVLLNLQVIEIRLKEAGNYAEIFSWK